MKMLLEQSGWDEQRLQSYLDTTVSPLRLACLTPAGYPAVVPLWYRWDGRFFWCVTHNKARLLKYLAAESRVGFEVANNTPPYCGVRGQGEVEIIRAEGGKQLEDLLERYLPSLENDFTRWLLGRKDEEVAIKIYPHTLSAWDYSNRMQIHQQKTG